MTFGRRKKQNSIASVVSGDPQLANPRGTPCTRICITIVYIYICTRIFIYLYTTDGDRVLLIAVRGRSRGRSERFCDLVFKNTGVLCTKIRQHRRAFWRSLPTCAFFDGHDTTRRTTSRAGGRAYGLYALSSRDGSGETLYAQNTTNSTRATYIAYVIRRSSVEHGTRRRREKEQKILSNYIRIFIFIFFFPTLRRPRRIGRA